MGFRGDAGLLTRLFALGLGSLALANCSGGLSGKLDPRYGVQASARVVEPGAPVPKGGGVYRLGKPYTVAGRTYVPEENTNYTAVGMASWYGDDFHGRYTANGEIFDMNSISAAHPTLPLPCYARVTDLANHRSIIVRVNDRGPYVGDRVIDLSVKAAKLLGFYGEGLAKVKVEYVGRAPLVGSDDRKLEATLREGTPAGVRVVPRTSRSCRKCSTRGRSAASPEPSRRRPTGLIASARDRARLPQPSNRLRPWSLPPRPARNLFTAPIAGRLAGFRLCPRAL